MVARLGARAGQCASCASLLRVGRILILCAPPLRARRIVRPAILRSGPKAVPDYFTGAISSSNTPWDFKLNAGGPELCRRALRYRRPLLYRTPLLYRRALLHRRLMSEV